jgi:DNA-binding XRE family transcriptional regulator
MEEPTRKPGQPKFEPSDEQRKLAEAMAAYGIPQEDIAKVVGIAPKTLREHFRHELDTGSTLATAKVAERLFKRATTDDSSAGITAAIFWLKTRARWKETDQHDHRFTDAEGNDLCLKVELISANKD